MPTVLSVDKCLDLLEVISRHHQGIGTRAMARELEINVTTVHNIATTLKHRGYLRQDPQTKRFMPGLRLMLLGRHAGLFNALSSAAEPVVAKVVSVLSETAMLAAFLDGRVVRLVHIASPQALCVREPEDLGEHSYCTATGKMMLACLPDASLQSFLEQTPLVQHTPKTLANRQQLLGEIQQIRQQGYATTIDELCEGVSAVAVPVYDPWGHPIAALGASMPTQRFNPAQQQLTIKTLLEYARQLTDIWTPPISPPNSPPTPANSAAPSAFSGSTDSSPNAHHHQASPMSIHAAGQNAPRRGRPRKKPIA